MATLPCNANACDALPHSKQHRGSQSANCVERANNSCLEASLRYPIERMQPASEPKYFPSLCRSGHRAFLAPVSLGASATERISCPSCGSRARLIPAAYYTEATRPRFDRVAEALDVSTLTREHASSVASELDRAARRDSREAVRHALLARPELARLGPLLPEEHREFVAFIGLLIALLDAYATASPIDSEDSRQPSELVADLDE